MKRQLFIILALLPLLVEADDVTDATSYTPRDWTIIPPAPEVASMMKFVTIPVSPFTGQPNIDLPIYTLREGAIEIPISIRYHGGGIKVDENAGILGLGWSLNAGGCISRTMYGFPDECNDNYKDVKGVFNLDDKAKKIREEMINRVDGYEPTLSAQCFPLSQCENIDMGLRDMSNDVFQINCMGYTGTFIYSPNSPRKMILSTSSPISFSGGCTTASSFNIGSFMFTDLSGNLYEFDNNDVDQTKMFYRSATNVTEFEDSLYYTSAWHISKISNLSGDTVTFKYIQDKYRFYTFGSNYYQSKSTDETVAAGGETSTASSVHYNAKIISEIITTSTIAVFTYNDDKETLKSISIHRNNANRDLIKKFVFKQTDFTIWDKTRKQLKEVVEYGTNDKVAIKLYEFIYSSGYSGEASARLAQDEWGYFNGVTTNEDLVYGPEGVEVDKIYFANREPQISYTQAGVLTSIKYPTGGSTDFTWEQNNYSYIKQSQIPETTKTEKKVREIILRGNAYNTITEDNLYNIDKVQIINIDGNSPFITIDCSKYIEPFASVFPWEEYDRTHYNTETQIMDLPRIEIRDSLNQVLKYWYIDHATSTSNRQQDLSYTFPSKGQYKIILCDPTNFEGVPFYIINGFFGTGTEVDDDYCYVKATLSQSYTSTTEKTKPWGGLRIASITSNFNESTSIRKSYVYKQDLSSDYSSGTIFEKPSYISKCYSLKSMLLMPNSAMVIKTAEIEGYHSNGLYSTPCGGSQIEYPYVWEIYPDNNTSIRYSYSSQRSIYDEVDAVYYDWIPGGSRMLTSNSHLRGNLNSKNYYFNGDIYRSENYESRYIENYSNNIFTGNLNRVVAIQGNTLVTEDGSWLSSNYAICRYKLVQYNKNPRSIETVEYDNNGASIVDSVYYTYFNEDEYNESPKYNLPRSKATINSKGEEEITYYTYLKDANGDAINFPETEVTVCGGYIINAKKMIYDNKYRLIATYTSSPGLSVENSFSLGGGFHATNALKNAINIPSYSYRYNDDGNLVEISYNGVVLSSYIWGYQGSHPIAEIKNVSYNDVCNTLPSSLHPDELSNSNNITEANLNSIRSYFPGKDIITMNYHWLIGVATTIDSRGIPTRYNYDSFGRLDGVKDYNNYFIKKYSYNFIND